MTSALVAGVVLVILFAAALAGVIVIRRVATVLAGGAPSISPPASPPVFGRVFPARLEKRKPNSPCSVTGLTKQEAEDLLDWFEATGQPQGQLSYAEQTGFTVTWTTR